MKLSILDLSIVPPSGDRNQAILNTIELAKQADRLGYHRYWVAEHHGAGTAVGRNPEVLVPYIADQTKNIRVGSGAVLLNHYSPYKVAEVFNSLEEMFPGRIDMGIGRATGGPIIDIALQQNRESYEPGSSKSAEQLQELLLWMKQDFPSDHPFSKIKSYNDGTHPQYWILGSSPWSSDMAAQLSLPYSFAAFINPSSSYPIAQNYIDSFVPAEDNGLQTSQPKLMVALNVFVAPTDDEARKMTAPFYLFQRRLQTVGDIHSIIPTDDEAIEILGGVQQIEPVTDPKSPPKVIAGTPQKVYGHLQEIADIYGANEIMMQTITSNHTARMKMLELLANQFES